MPLLKTGKRLFSKVSSSVKSRLASAKYEKRSRQAHLAAAKAIEEKLGYKCVVYDKRPLFGRRSDFGSSSRYGLSVFGLPSVADSLEKRWEVNRTIAEAMQKLHGTTNSTGLLVNALSESPHFLSSPKQEAEEISERGEEGVNFLTYHHFFAKPIYGKATHGQFIAHLKKQPNFPQLLAKARERLYTISGKRGADEFLKKLAAMSRRQLLGEVRQLVETLSKESAQAYSTGVRPEHEGLVRDGVAAFKDVLDFAGVKYSALVGRGSVFRGKKKPGDLDLSIIGIVSESQLPFFDVSVEHEGGKLKVNENFPVLTRAVSLARLPRPEEFAAFAHGLATSVAVGEGNERAQSEKVRQKYLKWLRLKLPLYRKKSLWIMRDHLQGYLEGFREKNARDNK